MITDVEYMNAFQAGDDKAFDQLVQRYYQQVYNYICHQCYDKAIAEDICQDTFVKLYNSRDKYKPVTTFKAFLFTVARNVFIDNYRKTKKMKTTSIDAVYGEGSFAAYIESVTPSSSDIIDSREKMAKIMNAIDQLPEILKDVFILSEIEQLKYSEISEILNIPVGTVKSRMFNAIKNLQKLLQGVLSHAV